MSRTWTMECVNCKRRSRDKPQHATSSILNWPKHIDVSGNWMGVALRTSVFTSTSEWRNSIAWELRIPHWAS